MKKLAFFLVLLFVLTVAPVEAALVVNKYTNDFTLYAQSNEQIKTCSCEPKTDLLILENIGNFQETYTLEVISQVADWAELPHNQITLNPGEYREIPIYIHTPCGETGTYDYDVKATNSHGRVEYLERSLRADQCNNVVLDVQAPTKATNLCQPTQFEVTLSNPSRYSETYKLDFGNYNEYMSIANTKVTLSPQESNTQTATLTLPCSYEGEYDIPFTAKAVKNSMQEKKIVPVTIENQFTHDVQIAQEIVLCSGVENTIPFTVKNTAPNTNTYKVDIDAPNFVNEEVSELSLESKDQKQVTLTANPAVGKEGTYDIAVSAIGTKDGGKKTREATLEVENCYALEVQTRTLQQEVIAQDTACCGTKEYALNIENQGTRVQTFLIDANAPDWFHLETTQVTLQPQENTNIKITSETPCTDDSYDFTITVTNSQAPGMQQTIPFTLNTKNEHSCYALAINEDEFVIDPSDKKIKLKVANEGIQAGVYDISLNDENFAFKETQIALEAGETKKLKLYVTNLTGKDFGRYIVEPSFTLAQTNNPVIKDIIYEEDLGVEYEDYTLFEKLSNATKYVCKEAGWCASFLILVILGTFAVAAGVVAILTRKIAPKYPAKDVALARVILLAIIIIILILIAFLKIPTSAGLYIDPMQPENYFVIANQDDIVQFTVDEHFQDPDADDVLTYRASQPESIVITTNNNIMTLIPDEGFSGATTFTITATDSQGAQVTSPELGIYVREKIELSAFQSWKRFCTQLNLGILLLIVLLLLLATFYVKEKRKPKEPKPIVAAKKTSPKKTVKKVAKKLATKVASLRSKALDRALVSQEPHEMRQILATHNKRGTARNVSILQKALKEFKASKGYKPKNRDNFYRYIKEKNILRTLRNK